MTPISNISDTGISFRRCSLVVGNGIRFTPYWLVTHEFDFMQDYRSVYPGKSVNVSLNS